jgi:23S rRNA pseudouridine1911/1915/1917 synthase
MCRILRYVAAETDEGLPARDLIRREFHLVAHDLARAKYKTDHGITVNGETIMINRLLHRGDVLEVRLTDAPSGKTIPAPGLLDILYEDEDLVCINKPAGIVVHPSHGHFADSLANFLAWHYQEEGDPHEIRTIGRLDKDTSGLIFYGKSRTVCAHMLEQTKSGDRVKTYLALAEGQFSKAKGSVEAPISREFEEKIRRVVRAEGDYALTHFWVLRQYEDYALLKVQIATGRTHQIRVHLSHIGHPLLGDPIYGQGPSTGPFLKLDRAALHAWHTTFRTPFDGVKKELTAPLPEDMRQFLTDDFACDDLI